MQQYLYAAAPFAAVITYLIIFFLDKQKRAEKIRKEAAGPCFVSDRRCNRRNACGNRPFLHETRELGDCSLGGTCFGSRDRCDHNQERGLI